MAKHESLIVQQLVVGDLQYKLVAVTVSAAASSGQSAADPDLVGGTIMGIVPTGNQDQFVDDVTLAVDGKVAVVLAVAATADNTFNVTVWRADTSYPAA